MASNLYQYYTSQGQSLPTVSERAKIYESSGLGSSSTYVGSAEQNTALLRALSGGTPTTIPVTTQTTAQTTNPNTTTQSTQTTTPSTSQDLINMGFGGYQGWSDTEAVANFKATGGQGKQTSTGTTGTTVPTTPTLDLTSLYDNLYNKAGVSDLEAELSSLKTSYDTAVSQINDNPYLSEATRVGRVAKLTTDYNNSAKTIQDKITSAKTDVETRLGLATKQYDINTSASQQALSNFNSLLSSGALNDASSSTISSLAASTGLSTDMINSAIKASNKTGVNTQLIQSTDNNGNVTVSIVNTDTGEVVKQTSLGNVSTSKSTGSGSGEDENSQIKAIQDDLTAEIKNGITLESAFALGAGYLSGSQILKLYDSNSIYGKHKESTEELKALAEKYGLTL